MKTNRMTVLRFLPSVISLLLAVGSATWFSACGLKEDGTWMRCHQAQTTVTALGTVLTVLLFLQALLPQKALRILLSAASIIVCVVIFLIPGTWMPMCMMHTMRCYTVMQPFVRIMAVLSAGCCLLQLISLLKGKARK